jgi:hypothetical protein
MFVDDNCHAAQVSDTRDDAIYLKAGYKNKLFHSATYFTFAPFITLLAIEVKNKKL